MNNTSGGLMSSGLRCYFGPWSICSVESVFRKQKGRRMAQIVSSTQAWLAWLPRLPPHLHAGVGGGLPFRPHAHLSMKFSTTKAKVRITGRGSFRGGQARCAGRCLREEQKAIVCRGRGAATASGQGCPHLRGRPSHGSSHCTGLYAAHGETPLDCFSVLTSHIRVFDTCLVNICVSSEWAKLDPALYIPWRSSLF